MEEIFSSIGQAPDVLISEESQNPELSESQVPEPQGLDTQNSVPQSPRSQSLNSHSSSSYSSSSHSSSSHSSSSHSSTSHSSTSHSSTSNSSTSHSSTSHSSTSHSSTFQNAIFYSSTSLSSTFHGISFESLSSPSSISHSSDSRSSGSRSSVLQSPESQSSEFQSSESQSSESRYSELQSPESMRSESLSTISQTPVLQRSESPQLECSICLEEITNRCRPNVCSHTFCFNCLRQWARIQLNCPLCKRNFTSIFCVSHFAEYDTQDEERGNRMDRVIRYQEMITRLSRGDANIEDHQMFRTTHHFFIIPRSSPHINPVEAQALRVRVYHENIWSLPMPNSEDGQFSPTNPAIYNHNTLLTIRIQEFVTREVNAIRSIQRSYGNRVQYVEEEAINFIMRMILKVNIAGMRMLFAAERFFGQYASHFCHELFNYASCCRTTIMQYDLNVAYTTPSTFIDRSRINHRDLTAYVPPSVPIGEIPTVEQPDESDIIVISSSRENSDDEDTVIINTGFETSISEQPFAMPQTSAFNTPIRDERIEVVGIGVSIDEPSTSTGIHNQSNALEAHSSDQNNSDVVQLLSSDDEPTPTPPVNQALVNNRKKRSSPRMRFARFPDIANRMSTRNRPQPPSSTSSGDSD